MTIIQPRNRTIVLNPYLDYPDLNSLPVRLAMTALEQSLETVRSKGSLVLTPDKLLDCAADFHIAKCRYPNLSDELREFLQLGESSLDKLIERSSKEFEVYEDLLGDMCSPNTLALPILTELITRIHRRVAPSAQGFRRGAMRTRPDSGGNTVIFPSAYRIGDLLSALSDRLATDLLEYPASAALVAYVALIHCHPFSDGNGRTARVLFNLMLSAESARPVFIPLSIWSHICGGSFLLKVRRAIYGNDWAPLFKFYRDSLVYLGQGPQTTEIIFGSPSNGLERRVS